MEAAIAGVTVVTCASLWFADRLERRNGEREAPDAHADAHERAKKRAIEIDRLTKEALDLAAKADNRATYSESQRQLYNTLRNRKEAELTLAMRGSK